MFLNHLSRDWRTADCETERYLLNTSILEIISSLPLSIASIAAYKSDDCMETGMHLFLSFDHTAVDHSESVKKDSHHSLQFPKIMKRIEPQYSSYAAFNTTENLPQSNADQNTERAQLSSHRLLRLAHLGPDIQKVENQKNEGLSKVKQSKTHKKLHIITIIYRNPTKKSYSNKT